MGGVQEPSEPPDALCKISVTFPYIHFWSKEVCGFCQGFRWVLAPRMLKGKSFSLPDEETLHPVILAHQNSWLKTEQNLLVVHQPCR